jgi:myo-inositol-1(or 4)-monophosphatase
VAPVSPSDLDGVLAVFRDAAAEAARIALAYFRPGSRTTARIDYKHGGSPVTEADLAVDLFLRERLCGAIPSAAWLSEETADSTERLGQHHVLVVDPIDGTRGYVSGDARWTVSIALVAAGRPTVGIVAAPVLGQLFEAVSGGGARCNGVPIHVSTRTTLDDAQIAGPANFAERLGRPVPFRIVPKIPSLACRFVHAAAGFVDGCVASSNSHDWDLAAADLIMHEAGGVLTDRHGTEPLYNQRVPRHPTLVGAPPLLHRALVDLLQKATD